MERERAAKGIFSKKAIWAGAAAAWLSLFASAAAFAQTPAAGAGAQGLVKADSAEQAGQSASDAQSGPTAAQRELWKRRFVSILSRERTARLAGDSAQENTAMQEAIDWGRDALAPGRSQTERQRAAMALAMGFMSSGPQAPALKETADSLTLRERSANVLLSLSKAQEGRPDVESVWGLAEAIAYFSRPRSAAWNPNLALDLANEQALLLRKIGDGRAERAQAVANALGECVKSSACSGRSEETLRAFSDEVFGA
jgi:hypothetical protein